MGDVVTAAKKFEAAQKLDERAQAKLKAAKGVKRTRKSTLEKLLVKAERTRGELDKVRWLLADTAGIRTINPAPAPPGVLPKPPPPVSPDIEGSVEVLETIQAHVVLITKSAAAIVELQD